MARFHGVVGFGTTKETFKGSGVWEEKHTEKPYYGDILKKVIRNETGEHLNDNVNVSHRISIVADEFAFMNFFAMKYVVWMKTRWRITDVEIERPRIILSIGGVYNGPENGTPKCF